MEAVVLCRYTPDFVMYPCPGFDINEVDEIERIAEREYYEERLYKTIRR